MTMPGSKAFPRWPFFDNDEVEAAMKVLRSGKVNYWTGEEGRLFEKEFTGYVGRRHGVALANGTVALELALYVLGIGPGDEVIVPSRTFIASASCVVMRGAIPVVADVDSESQNITAGGIRNLITRKTKAVVAVHLAGWPCDMDPLMQLAEQHDIRIIEDCAQAHGATYKGRPVGSFGDVAAFSFCQDKIMTTGGEGGMLVTDEKALWEKAWAFKDHGKNFSAVSRRRAGVFRWVHDSFGTNWRLTETQSAIGRLQLKKLPGWVERRREHASMLARSFSKLPALRVVSPPEGVGHSYYRYYTFIRPEFLRRGWSRDRVIAAINAIGIPCFSGVCSEIYLEKAFDGLRPHRRLPVARQLGETSMSFLVHPTLSGRHVKDTCRAVEQVMNLATRRNI